EGHEDGGACPGQHRHNKDSAEQAMQALTLHDNRRCAARKDADSTAAYVENDAAPQRVVQQRRAIRGLLNDCGQCHVFCPVDLTPRKLRLDVSDKTKPMSVMARIAKTTMDPAGAPEDADRVTG